MPGFRPFAPTDYYWVWSPAGPSFDGVFHGTHFVRGMHPFPMAAPQARVVERYGYTLTPYVEGSEFQKWDEEKNRYYAVFAVPEPVKKKRGRPKKNGS